MGNWSRTLSSGIGTVDGNICNYSEGKEVLERCAAMQNSLATCPEQEELFPFTSFVCQGCTQNSCSHGLQDDRILGDNRCKF
jgi:hypothetical protein